MNKNCQIIFDGKTLPELNSTVYIIRRTMKQNKNGRWYSAKSERDVELVEGTVEEVSFHQI